MKINWYVDKDNMIPDNTVYCYDPDKLIIKHYEDDNIIVEWMEITDK